MEVLSSNFDLLVATLVFVAALAAAIKGLPVVWAWMKSAYRFMAGMERIAEVPVIVEEQAVIRTTVDDTNIKVDAVVDKVGSIAESVKMVADDLRRHMDEEERLRQEEKNMVAQMVDSVDKLSGDLHRHVLEVADAVFRQAVFADPVAYYIVHWNKEEEKWDWVWANNAYFKLTGLTGEEARADRYWDMVHPDDQERVYEHTKRAGETATPIEIDFLCVNVRTGEENPVRVVSWPMLGETGRAVGFLGAIQVLSKS